MSYNYKRDFDSFTGRYIESDPFGVVTSISTYSYSSNSPIMKLDRTGELTYDSTCGARDRALIDSGIQDMGNGKGSTCNNGKCGNGKCTDCGLLPLAKAAMLS